MKKKWLLVLLSLAFLLCSAAGFAAPKLKVVLYMNGTLGDKSFFDSANRGVQKAAKELPITAKVIEGTYDSSAGSPTSPSFARATGTLSLPAPGSCRKRWKSSRPSTRTKSSSPIDTSVTYSKGGLDNVYSILYKQNEGSFLVGALAAMVTNSKMPLANKQKVIGFLGGMDIPVINDFKVGFEQGAKYVDPSSRCWSPTSARSRTPPRARS